MGVGVWNVGENVGLFTECDLRSSLQHRCVGGWGRAQGRICCHLPVQPRTREDAIGQLHQLLNIYGITLLSRKAGRDVSCHLAAKPIQAGLLQQSCVGKGDCTIHQLSCLDSLYSRSWEYSNSHHNQLPPPIPYKLAMGHRCGK